MIQPMIIKTAKMIILIITLDARLGFLVIFLFRFYF